MEQVRVRVRLVSDPVVIPMAEMRLRDDGMEQLLEWLKEYDPSCLDPAVHDPRAAIFPHDGTDAGPGGVGRRVLADGELYTELCGRGCYRSYGEKAGRKSNAEYLANLFGEPGKIPHACYDGETEVLTASGWKFFSDLTGEELLATRTPEGALQYQKPSKVFRYEYSGRMFSVDSPGVNLLVTPNHNMLICPTTTRRGRERGDTDFRLIPAEQIGDMSHAYVKDARWGEGRAASETEKAALALLGFAIGDGRIQDAGFQVEFHLKRPRKIEWLRATALKAGWQLRETRGDRYALSVDRELMPLFRDIYDSEGEKQIPPGVLLDWDSEALWSLLEGLINSDGSIMRTHTNYSSTSLRLLDQVQQLALHCGMAAHLHVRGAQCPHVNFIERNLRPEFSRGSILPRPSWIENWSGLVYCAEVPNHTLYVRRNGIPVWCGNSVLYHAKLSFFFANISRRVSHELIRHYVGADRDEEGSPSQESTRFAHHPGWFSLHPRDVESPEERLAFERDMQEAYESYLNYLNRQVQDFADHHGEPPKGMDKKRIYESAAQRLPGAACTSFYWTTNPEALSKMFRERCDYAADLEIQRFARKLQQVCYREWPNLFRESNYAYRNT